MLGADVQAVDRPWGSYAVLATDPGTDEFEPVIAGVKILIVNPGEVLSLQSHRLRAERWMAIDPGCTATIGDETEYMIVGFAYDVRQGVVHRIANGSERPVRIVEVLFGTYDEDDIVRVEDRYGRC